MPRQRWGQLRAPFRRGVPTRRVRDRILIVCEGEKTEPNYFHGFPVNLEIVAVDIEGAGANTTSVVRRAIELMQQARTAGQEYNQAWCVFDRDSFPAQNFNEALRLAEGTGIRVAYSNPCFELWYYLHYHFNDVAMDRHQYAERLTECLGRAYKKNDGEMYRRLRDAQPLAIRHAKKLLTLYHPCRPENDDPSTTVYLLVEALNRFLPGHPA